MGSEWRELPAQEFCASVRDGTHDSPKPVERGRRLVTSRHLTTGRLDLASAYLISDEDFAAISKRSKVDRWDVLLSMIGTVGEPCLIRDEPDFAIKNIGLFKSKGELEGKWLYYYLRGPRAQQAIRELSRGTTQQYIPLEALRRFPVVVPGDPAEMRAVVRILGDLDDKIELNRRMSQTLESTARALFKSWFVDFDPVRAKAEGRDPSLHERWSGLFPDCLDASELGEIPEGWAAGRIGDVAGRIVDRVEDAAVWQDEPLIDLSRMPQRSIALTDWGLGAEMAGSVTRFRARDTLFGAIRPYFHKVGIAPMDGVTNVSVFVLRARREKDWPFVALVCSMSATVDYATRVAKGTKMPVVTWPDFENYPIPLPPSGTREAFDRVVGPLLERIAANTHESHSLAAAQNTLLPRLVSGELSLRDAERFVGDGG